MQSQDSQMLLALDLGTTNVKALVVDVATLSVISAGSAAAKISFPKPGCVEQDGEQIWEATATAIRMALSSIDSSKIVGITVSNQRESAIVWDRGTGKPVGPILGWQDTRTAPLCDSIRERGLSGLVRKRTGLQLDAMFSAPKLRALLQLAVADGHAVSSLVGGTLDSWIIYKLTGEFLTEVGNASRTLLFDIYDLEFETELLDIFGIPRSMLAEVRYSDAGFGETIDSSLLHGVLPSGIPILAVLADSHSALYLHSGGRLGEGKVTFGTGSSVMVPMDASTKNVDGIATTIAWGEHGQTVFGREGNILATGAALAWMSKILTDGDVVELGRLAEESAGQSEVQFVPAFTGLAAPYFDRGAVGLIQGLTSGISRADIAHAAMESVCQQVMDVLEAMEADDLVNLETLHADGGASKSVLLMQILADFLDREVKVAQVAEASAMGAALMGARKLGYSPLAGALNPDVVTPQKSAEWRETRRTIWRDAVARSRFETNV